MRKSRVYQMGFLTVLLVFFMAGCGKETINIPDTTAPFVVSTTPAAGATGAALNPTISATFNEAMAPSTISTTTFTVTGPGGPVAGTVALAANTATFTPTTPLAAQDTLYTATITTGAQDADGNAMADAYIWHFETTEIPSVASVSPSNGATGVAVNTTISATFATDSDSPNAAIKCSTLNSPATTFTLTGPGATAVPGTVSCAGATATFSPAAVLAFNTVYTATITTGAQNLAGNGLVAPFVWTFRTNPAPPTPPTVISTNPVNNAIGVPINQKVAATFSEAMNPATINSTTFTLTGPGGVAVAGAVTYVVAGSTATFTPAANLAALTTYVATITTGAQDLAGNALASNYVWTFTTGAAPDTTSPTVIATIPTNMATGVPFNQAVSATFSEAMDPATINATTFKLAGPGTTPVAGLVAYSAVGNSATFTPTAPLLPSTVYTATITNGAKDLAGNPLVAGIAPNPWTFTTAATAPALTPPIIVSTNPANASVGVAINATVNATFSKAMNPLTITTGTFTVTGPGGVAVAGTVAYDAINFIATFTPSSNLALTTTYTATITTGAQDLTGNALAGGGAPNPWIFTTGAAAVPAAVNLGTAGLFGGIGGAAGMTNQGILTVVNGDIGTTGASTLVTGFHDIHGDIYTETPLNIGSVNGEIDTCPPPPGGTGTEGNAVTCAIATQALADATTAYNNLAAIPGGLDVSTCPGCGGGLAGELGNRTLAPGTYKSAPGSYGITAGDLTLDAQGNPNAVWVFQMATSLTVGIAGPTGARNVILINGAQAKNVYWQVGSAATINAAGGGTFVGTVIAQAGATTSTAGNLVVTTINGRLLGLNASVTLVNTVINVPAL
ncbi:MAG: Ig-like domain-containing protein [Terriglobia bacterium]